MTCPEAPGIYISCPAVHAAVIDLPAAGNQPLPVAGICCRAGDQTRTEIAADASAAAAASLLLLLLLPLLLLPRLSFQLQAYYASNNVFHDPHAVVILVGLSS